VNNPVANVSRTPDAVTATKTVVPMMGSFPDPQSLSVRSAGPALASTPVQTVGWAPKTDIAARRAAIAILSAGDRLPSPPAARR
jgi:hypothetical protein